MAVMWLGLVVLVVWIGAIIGEKAWNWFDEFMWSRRRNR